MSDSKDEVTSVTISSLPEYITEILKLQPGQTESKLVQQSLLYRGLADKGYDLTPSISRTKSKHWAGFSKLIYERSLIESAKSRYPDRFDNYDCPLELLAKLQHYHIPTRLLDVTSNALVALYFACCDLNDEKDPDHFKDGQVIIFSGLCLSRYNEFVSIIADTYNLTGNAQISLDTLTTRIKSMPYGMRLLYESSEFMNVENFRYHLSSPLFVEPGFISQRQVNQSGKFVICPNVIHGSEVTGRLKVTEKTDEQIVTCIQIKKESKIQILSDLERLGITYEFLFPDDIDSNCSRLAKSIDDRFEDHDIG